MSEDYKFTETLKKQLKIETEDVTRLKEQTWQNIQAEIEGEKTKHSHGLGRRLLAVFSGLGVVVVFGVVLWSSFPVTKNLTDEGGTNGVVQDNSSSMLPDDTEHIVEENLIHDINQQFPPEKDIEIEVEGMKEVIHGKLAVNATGEYVYYYDKDRYVQSSHSGIDRIVPIEQPALNVPEVSMEISYTELTEADVIKRIKMDLEIDNFHLFEEQTIEEPMHGRVLTALAEKDYKWDTAVHRFYIYPIQNGNTIIFQQKFFTEAFEGHGARFDEIIKTFLPIHESF